MTFNSDDIRKPYYDAQERVHDSPYGHLHLRDLFAAFALAGLANTEGVVGQLQWTAATAYDLADAMLAQRREGRK